jgi:predicted nucleic acid-binding protein
VIKERKRISTEERKGHKEAESKDLLTLPPLLTSVQILLFASFCVFRSSELRIRFSAEREKDALRKLLRRFRSVPMSFADACLVRTSEIHSDCAIWTLDSDFRIYRSEIPAPDKLRDLHFDVLIALTARSHGARLVTSNRSDFELIDRYRRLQLEIW